MGQLIYPHRIVIRKNIITPEFTLGAGCTIILDLASKQLTKLLIAVYDLDKSALEYSRAVENYLLNGKKNPRRQVHIPCISVPKPICYQPRIIEPSQVHGK